MTDASLDVGVIGVGSMGQNHVRVYQKLPSTTLVGVSDVDRAYASEAASSYGTEVYRRDALLEAVDAVSVAVPTRHHYEVARAAIDAGVHVLVEKPFVGDRDQGWDLVTRAREADLVLQVGHIERFNPATATLEDVVADLDVIAFDANRLGPPVDRDIEVDAVLDLMIHDIDIVGRIVGDEVTSIDAASHADGDYVTAVLGFGNDVVGTLTASRVTQQKVRTLSVTARECRVVVDYIDQSVEIYRRSVPEYVEANGDVRYRHRSLVEQVAVDGDEPLEAELAAFVDAVASGTEPAVTGEEGMWALDVAERIGGAAAESAARRVEEVGAR